MTGRHPRLSAFVPTAAIRDAVQGRENNILSQLCIQGSGKKHIRCPYPDHQDNHPSWRWDPAKRRAYCTCMRSDSIFDVICKMKGINFDAAKVEAAKIIGRTDLIRRQRRKNNGREGVQSAGNDTATPQHPGGCTLADYAEAKHLRVDSLRSFGISEMYYQSQPAVRIPYYSADGKETAIRFRVALDGNDKFRWRRGNRALLYGLDRIAAARQGGAIALVEGESDCHTLWQEGFPAVGLPGAATWNEERDTAIFHGIATIFVVIEPDNGGDNVRRSLAKSKIRDRVKLVRLVGFKDPSALYLDDPASFAERWRATLDAAVPWRDEAERERHEAREAAWKECGELARLPNILSKMTQFVQAHGLVGEERIVKLIYLVATTRLLRRIVSLAVKGPSSGGKSFLVEIVLRLFPPEAFYVLTAMSDHALAYGEESLVHRIIVLYEAAGLTGDFGTYLVRSLLSEGRIFYETVEKTKDGLKARRIEREGPTGLITTTTAIGLHPENETRLLSVTVTDTPEQTKLIMRAQAGRHGRTDKFDFARWHALQQAIALGPAHVVIPFASELAELIPPVAVRLRRDYPTLLSLIEAHALLHQATRERSADGAVVATLEDYSAVREIVADLVSQGVGATVSKTLRETVDAVARLEGNASSDGVSTTTLGQKLNLDKSSTSRRAKEALARGYLKNLEDKRGRPARLVLGDPLPDEIAVLPIKETLETKCCTVAPLKQGTDVPPSPAAIEEEEMAWTV
jgi:hypothetical protein